MSQREHVTVHETDVEGIRAAAQWLLATLGGVLVLVLAGFQLSNLRQVLETWPSVEAIGTAVALLLLIAGGWALTHAAASVLVPDRSNLTDLLTSSAMGDVRSTSGSVMQPDGRPHTDGDTDILHKHVRDEIARARGWLLPASCQDLDDLNSQYQQAQDDERDSLRAVLAEVSRFARTESALWRFRRLRKLVLGWAGASTVIGLGLLVLYCQPPAPSLAPEVTEPIKVTVRLTSDSAVLARQGLKASCATAPQTGVIIGGTLAEPLVLINSSPLCDTARVLMTDDLGYAIPV